MSFLFVFSVLVITITLIGVAIGRWPWLRMNRATIALVGATALVGSGALSLEQAYRAVDWNTVVLLFAMMVLNVNLRLAGFFHRVTGYVVRFARTPRRLLAMIVGVSGVLSAVFLNDTIALTMTPIVLELTRTLRRDPLPYLVGLVTAANVGSVATITGNPQNMLVGLSSGLPFVEFSRVLGPVALVGLLIIWAVIVLVYRAEYTQPFIPTHVEVPGTEDAPLLRKAMLATGLMIVGLVAGVPIPLAALIAAAVLLISRRRDPEHVFEEIDWGLLVFFASLFVVTGAIETSGFGAQLFAWMRPWADGGPAKLTFVSVVLSNIVSNVPAVMLFRPVVPTLAEPHQAWLTLAMATTLAGNLTLLGSVANLIVAEIARRSGVRLSFGEYLKAGTPIALLTLLCGVWWLS
ncbi:anion transporter [Opitutus terrae]|uniref:Citrate transporter n=1 Tax=Opitutus terrae (strain DSM 11246 / JCM 15787 / PB90-1) TaxID=452637 RepID=B1ZWQ1_OPITP|nr:anion transporter [Opitutus terrae]ACB74178.1 Citrate transporter [Opitutus terrae PB90-1]